MRYTNPRLYFTLLYSLCSKIGSSKYRVHTFDLFRPLVTLTSDLVTLKSTVSHTCPRSTCANLHWNQSLRFQHIVITSLVTDNAYTVRHLQRVQNTAARLVLDVPHSSPSRPLLRELHWLPIESRINVPHSSPSQPLLRELHWLPIESRIKFKLCVLIYRVSGGTAPLYLCELCKPCTDSRLRSKSRGDFIIPRTRLWFTDRAFAISAPSAWNSLPIDIRDCSSEAIYKKHLKTFLFHVAFN